VDSEGCVTEQERQDKLERLRQCIKLGEDAYDQLYEPQTHNNPAGHYSDAKDFFGEAIGLANTLGLNEQAQELSERLAHIKAVYRSQFSGFDSASQATPAFPALPTPAEHTSSDEFTETVRLIRANAALVVSTCLTLAGFEFNYASRSVEWLDGYIERIRTGPTSSAELEQLVSNFGSYLGEAIIAAYGGAWSQDEYCWHIRFNEKNRAYPFNKVEKQLLNGPEDSIFAFYRSIGPLISDRPNTGPDSSASRSQ
jgi:hypothetical protein